MNSTGDGPRKDDEENRKGRKNTAVHNIQDFFKNTAFGSLIKDSVEKTKKYVQGQPVYKVIEDVGKHLKRGDQLYLDNLHKDHLEVFRSNINLKQYWIFV